MESRRLPIWATWVVGLTVFALATAAAIWLGGFFFLVFSKVMPFGKVDFTTWWAYWTYYGSDPAVGKRLDVSMICAAVVSYGAPIALAIAANREIRALHGAARFATAEEVERSGLLGAKGIVIGKYKGRFLLFDGQQFVILMAPTRSGKGVSTVIPNLLSWNESVVVLDVKLENYDITAGYRAKFGQEVYLFNPFSESFRTARYNPLGYVRDGDFRVADLTAIGEVFYPSGGKDSFFDDQARNLFVGLGLYLCETPDLPRTIGEMLRQSSGGGLPIKEYLEGIIEGREEAGNPLSAECCDALFRFVNTSDNTRTSILASFNAPLGIWSNPIVDAATSENDFDLRDVRRRRMSIYIGITPDYLPVAGRLVNLFFSQLINLNTKVLPQADSTLKYTCLMVMDEFTAMGTVSMIAKAISYQAGYGLRLLIIVQSPAQLEDDPPRGYGRQGARNIITNCAAQVLFAPREQQDAEAYSKMLGDETVKSKSTSRQLDKSQRSESVSDQRRALLLPQEIKEIGQWKQIVIMENMKPILCDKIRYFDDAVFLDRLKSVSPSLAQLGKKKPKKKDLDRAIQGAELAPLPPLLDMDKHRARVQRRIRAATPADLVDGSIDLGKLALNLKDLAVPEPDGSGNLPPEEVQNFVEGFFAQLVAPEGAREDGSDLDDVDSDGAGHRPNHAELMALEAAASNEEIELADEWTGADGDPMLDSQVDADFDAESGAAADASLDLNALEEAGDPTDDYDIDVGGNAFGGELQPPASALNDSGTAEDSGEEVLDLSVLEPSARRK